MMTVDQSTQVQAQTALRLTRSGGERVITRRNQLSELGRWRDALTPPPRVLLRIPALEISDAARWETQINGDLHACGCGEGRLALALSLLAYGAFALFGPSSHMLSGWHRVATWLGILFGSAILGKIAGFLRARLRLRRRLRALNQALDPAYRAS